MGRQKSRSPVRFAAQNCINDGLVFVGDAARWKRLSDRQLPITVMLVRQLIAEAHERTRSALADQGAVEVPVKPLPFRISLEVIGAQRPWRSAESVMSDDNSLRKARDSTQQRVFVSSSSSDRLTGVT
jgi:hypothetical protein